MSVAPVFVVIDEATDLFAQGDENASDEPAGRSLSGWFRENPAMRELLVEARARIDRAVSVTCPWGWCTNDVDPVDGVILGGMGPAMCPCEDLPGWNAPYVAGRAKPQVPVKVAGRHGSRVQRSTRRHALPYWGDDLVWLPVRSRTAVNDAAVNN